MLMKPEVSAGCHQTLSRRWGLGTRLARGGGMTGSHDPRQASTVRTDPEVRFKALI